MGAIDVLRVLHAILALLPAVVRATQFVESPLVRRELGGFGKAPVLPGASLADGLAESKAKRSHVGEASGEVMDEDDDFEEASDDDPDMPQEIGQSFAGPDDHNADGDNDKGISGVTRAQGDASVEPTGIGADRDEGAEEAPDDAEFGEDEGGAADEAEDLPEEGEPSDEAGNMLLVDDERHEAEEVVETDSDMIVPIADDDDEDHVEGREDEGEDDGAREEVGATDEAEDMPEEGEPSKKSGDMILVGDEGHEAEEVVETDLDMIVPVDEDDDDDDVDGGADEDEGDEEGAGVDEGGGTDQAEDVKEGGEPSDDSDHMLVAEDGRDTAEDVSESDDDNEGQVEGGDDEDEPEGERAERDEGGMAEEPKDVGLDDMGDDTDEGLEIDDAGVDDIDDEGEADVEVVDDDDDGVINDAEVDEVKPAGSDEVDKGEGEGGHAKEEEDENEIKDEFHQIEVVREGNTFISLFSDPLCQSTLDIVEFGRELDLSDCGCHQGTLAGGAASFSVCAGSQGRLKISLFVGNPSCEDGSSQAYTINALRGHIKGRKCMQVPHLEYGFLLQGHYDLNTRHLCRC